ADSDLLAGPDLCGRHVEGRDRDARPPRRRDHNAGRRGGDGREKPLQGSPPHHSPLVPGGGWVHLTAATPRRIVLLPRASLAVTGEPGGATAGAAVGGLEG